MTTLFSESFSKLASFIFDFYDFDKDGKISSEDVRVVLSYIPLNTKKYSQMKLKFEQEDFKDRVESQDELHLLLEKCFKNSDILDQSGFSNVVENVCSDIFLFILIFLMEKRPFSKKTLNEFTGSPNKSKNLLGLGINRTPVMNPTRVLIASPNLQSKFTPSVTISKSPLMSKRNTLNLNSGGNLDSKSMLMRLSGKTEVNNDNRSVLLKYAGKSEKGTGEGGDEGTDEGVSINNIKNIPIQRKQRHNLRNIETVNGKETSEKKNTDYDSLTILPAVKYHGQPKEE